MAGYVVLGKYEKLFVQTTLYVGVREAYKYTSHKVSVSSSGRYHQHEVTLLKSIKAVKCTYFSYKKEKALCSVQVTSFFMTFFGVQYEYCWNTTTTRSSMSLKLCLIFASFLQQSIHFISISTAFPSEFLVEVDGSRRNNKHFPYRIMAKKEYRYFFFLLTETNLIFMHAV